jgi:hypothetical protein
MHVGLVGDERADVMGEVSDELLDAAERFGEVSGVHPLMVLRALAGLLDRQAKLGELRHQFDVRHRAEW